MYLNTLYLSLLSETESETEVSYSYFLITVPFNSIQQGVWLVTCLTKFKIQQVGLWPVIFIKFRQALENFIYYFF